MSSPMMSSPMSEELDDPKKENDFERVVGKMLSTPPKPVRRKTAKKKKAAKAVKKKKK